MSTITSNEIDECPHCGDLKAQIATLEQSLAKREHDFQESHDQSHRLFVKFLEANIKLWQHQTRLKEAEEKVISSENRLKVCQDEARSRELLLKRSNQDLRASLDRKVTTGRKALEKLASLRDELKTPGERPPTPQSEKDHMPRGTDELRIEIDQVCGEMASLAATQSDTEQVIKNGEWLSNEMDKLLHMQATLAQTLDQLCTEAKAVKEHNKQLMADIKTKEETMDKYRTRAKEEEARNAELSKHIEGLEKMMPLGWMTQRRGTLGWVGLRKMPSQVHLDTGLE